MHLPDVCTEVVQLIEKVGHFIWSQKDKVAQKDVEIKDLNSLVSYVDKKAEQQLVEGLRALVPEAGFIAEEGTGTPAATYNWIIDPLDGTTNFLFGLPTFAISVALAFNKEIRLGVVYEIGQKEMFAATKGNGAFLNGNPIRVSQKKALKEGLFATGFPYYDFSRIQGFLNLLHHMVTHTRGVRRIGSAATDLAYVACGRFDGFFEYGLSPWDVAAGALLVQEAGGLVSDYKGGENYLFGGEIAVGSKALHREMLDQVQLFMS